ncbi:glycosyltransferase [Jiangella alkaliphila]|uniref:UDP:flavonoid glycosyltransferase YjiC, YdhE family n=1 Tax=Jiangella alkaliphila TaxID=419479 RepID=A0A1H2L0Z0_9ACTN|nr:nucleotide disphospho-sugar-binding domain-containing protein [Jiangella alkaliphila]SDU74717.1 UDP:flavonoid glycosyltransferase YjiC, YdhE family [Jiangella alkaliphila]
MATFLIASIAVEAHTTNPLPIAARLIERGHTVLWYAGRAFHERIARTGATPLPYVDAPDFSGQDIDEFFPQFRGKSGPKMIGEAFDQIFVGHAPQRVADLRRIVAAHPVDAMLTEGLSYGVGMVSELEDIPWATFADGPLPYEDADTPPFGPGLLPMRGPAGRLRNRLVAAAADRLIFRAAERRYESIRAGLGLPRDPGSARLAGASSLLHLQACTPSFEYPRRDLPPQIHWIGALRPDPRPWQPPVWWDDLGADGRPVVHVTQGSLRPDLTELVLPAVRGLADEPVQVVVTTGGASRADLEQAAGAALPANCLVVPWIPYDELLARADVFVTNGGYTGVTLALAHGVPIVQAGTTEEKAENAARIQWSGVGLRLGKTHPAPAKVRAAVRRVLDEPSFRTAARRIQAEMAEHDAANEAAGLLERLARTRRPVHRADAAAGGDLPVTV